MLAYTFRINEINVFFYQQIMKNFDAKTNKKDINADEVEELNEDPNTKYSKYILNNYFFISFKVAVAICLINLGLPELYEKVNLKI